MVISEVGIAVSIHVLLILVKIIRLLMLTLSTGFFLFDNVASTKHLKLQSDPD